VLGREENQAVGGDGLWYSVVQHGEECGGTKAGAYVVAKKQGKWAGNGGRGHRRFGWGCGTYYLKKKGAGLGLKQAPSGIDGTEIKRERKNTKRERGDMIKTKADGEFAPSKGGTVTKEKGRES